MTATRATRRPESYRPLPAPLERAAVGMATEYDAADAARRSACWALLNGTLKEARQYARAAETLAAMTRDEFEQLRERADREYAEWLAWQQSPEWAAWTAARATRS